jgi:hypothetical protein
VPQLLDDMAAEEPATAGDDDVLSCPIRHVLLILVRGENLNR